MYFLREISEIILSEIVQRRTDYFHASPAKKTQSSRDTTVLGGIFHFYDGIKNSSRRRN